MTPLTASGARSGHRADDLFRSERMADGMTVSWQGDSYEVTRKDDRQASPDPGPVWQVTRDGALITSFPANADDRPAAVRDKVVAWLEANASRPASDIGRQ